MSSGDHPTWAPGVKYDDLLYVIEKFQFHCHPANSSLSSKRFCASSSRKLGREQRKKGMMGEGEGKEGTAITRLETLATQAISILIIRHCKVMFWIFSGAYKRILLKNDSLLRILPFPGYFETPLFGTFFNFPPDFEIAGFNCILLFPVFSK